jgi:hypothetical protein
MIMLNAMPRQMFAIVTQNSSEAGADRNAGFRTPSSVALYAMIPAPDSSSSNFQMMPITTPGKTQPTSTMARTAAAPGNCRRSPSQTSAAINRPNTNWPAMLAATKITVTRSIAGNSAEPSTPR